jgi:hypothetical protein
MVTLMVKMRRGVVLIEYLWKLKFMTTAVLSMLLQLMMGRRKCSSTNISCWEDVQ